MIEKFTYYRENLYELSAYSTYIKLFFNGISKEKLNMCKEPEERNNCFVELFNNFYQTKRWFYFKVLDELLLRGASIESRHFNISVNDIKYNEYLYCDADTNKFLKINFSRYGLEEFTEYFDVNSDYFFNYIPLEAFKLFSEEVNLNLLKEEFVLNGFTVVSLEDKKNYDVLEMGYLFEESVVMEDEELYEKILETLVWEDRVWVSLEGLSKKFSVSEHQIVETCKTFKKSLVIAEKELAHIDNIYVSLEEEKFIKERLALKEDKSSILDNMYLRESLMERNETIGDDLGKIYGIIEYLIGEME